MRAIGFSTGSLARSDYCTALDSLRGSRATAVELSALREHELEPLMRDLSSLDLQRFAHVSVHAPSALQRYDEASLIKALGPALDAKLPVIVHADIIQSPAIWKSLGRLLCIENMDKRKATGRTASELRPLFKALRQARLCLDLAHARQVDPSLCEIAWMVMQFPLAQLHVSELDAQSRHAPPSFAAIAAIRSVATLIARDVPAILEFDAKAHELDGHMRLVSDAFESPPRIAREVG